MPEQEEVQQSAAQPAPAPQVDSTLVDLLKQQQDYPGEAQIQVWKQQHRDVFVSGLAENEFFVFRALKRAEWRQLQARREDPKEQLDQMKQEEVICEICVLWPKITPEYWVNGAKAGTASTLAEQVMAHSHFMAPQLAAALVQKL